jgi:hypothetical protein
MSLLAVLIIILKAYYLPSDVDLKLSSCFNIETALLVKVPALVGIFSTIRELPRVHLINSMSYKLTTPLLSLKTRRSCPSKPCILAIDHHDYLTS